MKTLNQVDHFNSDNKNILKYLYEKNIHRPEEIDKDLYDSYSTIRSKLDTMSKKEFIKYMSAKKLDRNLLPRDLPLRTRESIERFEQYLVEHSYLADGTDTINTYVNKLKQWKFSKKDYEKIALEIEKYWSILPTSPTRVLRYGAGGWSVVLSETTGKMYCVDSNEDKTELLSDYKWYQYYESRSWASWGLYIIAGKHSIIYLPINRSDIPYPWYEFRPQKVNWVNLTARSDRWVVDKNYPITIFAENADHDFVFIDPHNVLETIKIIKSWWQLPENYTKQSLHICNYFDENGEEKSLDITYMADKPWSESKIINIMEWSNYIEGEKPELENVSEFLRVMWIYKLGNNFVEKWLLDLPVTNFGENYPPKKDSDLFDYEVWAWWELTKDFYDDWQHDELIRWWEFLSDIVSYKLNKKTWKYIVMLDYKFDNLGLSENSKELNKYFSTSSVGTGQSYRIGDYDFELASQKWSVVIVAKDIDKNDINNIVNIMKTQLKSEISNIYERELAQAFSEGVRGLENGIDMKGWETYKDMVYTSFGDKIYSWIVVKNTDLNPKFNKLEEFQDYEKVISKKEWEEYGEEYWYSYLREHAYNKSVKDYLNVYRRDRKKQIEEAQNYLVNNPDKKFFVDDSLNVWNCLPGTESFVERYNLKNGITAKELLEHKKIDEMLERNEFRKIILSKVEFSID